MKTLEIDKNLLLKTKKHYYKLAKNIIPTNQIIQQKQI